MEPTAAGFIGLGLIGGSIAKALKKYYPQCRIFAYDKDEGTLMKAREEGIVDVICKEQEPGMGECTIIFLCAPVSANISYLRSLKPVLRPECVLTDVGSVKGDIHKVVKALKLEEYFIGGHPMAGSEKTGYENSSDHLIENAYYILTPSEGVGLQKISDYSELVNSLGAIPMILTWEEHDYITAAVSHLPHVVASSLVNLVERLDSADEHMKMIAAGGFKDITRIASSSPVMWQQICLTNQENLSSVLDEYIRMIVQAKYLVDQGDSEGLYQMFADSREYRNSMDSSPLGPIKKAYILYCDIVDETGAIATIATTLAMHQISIKNIGIVHNREFEEGVLKIEFYQEEAMADAAGLLRKRNYIIYER